MESDWKMRRRHLGFERGLELLAPAAFCIDGDTICRRIGRCEKRQTLDVVPVAVRKQKRRFNRLSVGGVYEIVPERANAASCVEDQQLIAVSKFQARSISAIAHIFRRWRGDRTADSSEPDRELIIFRHDTFWSGDIGRRIRKVVPASLLSTVIVPPWASTTVLAMARPNPVPPLFPSVTNGSKIFGNKSARIPCPVSMRSNWACDSTSRTEKRKIFCSPTFIASRAFLIRFPKTRSIRWRSIRTDPLKLTAI